MKKSRNILFVIFTCVVIFAVVALIAYRGLQSKREKAYEEMQQQAHIEQMNVEEPSSEEMENQTDIPIDFAAVCEQNEDIYAWIRIEDTPVDYPILMSQGAEDYYLDHTVDGTEGLPGSIYTQYTYNTKSFEDPVTVIYGHNMRDKTMFGCLDSYLQEDFREAHSTIEIYTPEHIFTYKVVCAVTYDKRLILNTYHTDVASEYEQFLESLSTVRMIPSWMEEPLPVTTDDRMIILSTCNGNEDQRFLVGAVLVDEK